MNDTIRPPDPLTATPESAALERASNGNPVSEDRFAHDQSLVQWANELSPDTFDDWMGSLTIEEAKRTIELLQRVRDEHIRRSGVAESIETEIRGRLERATTHQADREKPLAGASFPLSSRAEASLGVAIGPGSPVPGR